MCVHTRYLKKLIIEQDCPQKRANGTPYSTQDTFCLRANLSTIVVYYYSVALKPKHRVCEQLYFLQALVGRD